jgi:hypothetical protein
MALIQSKDILSFLELQPDTETLEWVSPPYPDSRQIPGEKTTLKLLYIGTSDRN